MGLLGKLFGDDDLDKKAKGFFNSLVGSKPQNTPPAQQVQQNNYYAAPSQPQPQAGYAPSGFSWGEDMPAEENQFNSGMKYYDYFEKIYREEFPDYVVTREMPRGDKYCLFTFSQGGRVALKVEVISQSCGVYKERSVCRMQGIGYTRFYHDHYGWWNTRSYVIERTRSAIR